MDGENQCGRFLSVEKVQNDVEIVSEAEYGSFKSITVVRIPTCQAESEYSEEDYLYEKREGVCESDLDSGLVDSIIQKGSAQAVYSEHN